MEFVIAPTARTTPLCIPPPSDCQRGRVTLGSRWPEYHGRNDWEGLLHPLDDRLRSELLRYGDFVRSAYRHFAAAPSSPMSAPLLAGTGYVATDDLHAAPGVRLPGSDPAASWIGYVAVCADEDEVGRLGRRDIVVAYRGTATWLEWVENLRVSLTHMEEGEGGGMVQRGFWSLYTSPSPLRGSLRQEVRGEVRRLLREHRTEPVSVTVTGHSLGAALAVLTAHDIAADLSSCSPGAAVAAVCFGGPRVGDAGFRACMEARGGKVLRVVNTRDIVTKVPGGFAGGGGGGAYCDVGQELRVRGRRGNVVACHDLDHYLQLVRHKSRTCAH